MQALAIAAIVVINAVCFGLAFQPARAGTPLFWVLVCAPTIVLGLVALVRMWRQGELGHWLRPKAGDFTLGILVAALQFGLAYVASRVLTKTGHEIWLARLYLQLGDPNDLRAHPILLFAGLFVTCALEEILWRGMVMELFAERLGSRWAWLWQALANGACYLPTIFALSTGPGQVDPIMPPMVAIGAVVTGLMVRKMDRLPAAIVAHGFFDYAVVVMFRLWGTSL